MKKRQCIVGSRKSQIGMAGAMAGTWRLFFGALLLFPFLLPASCRMDIFNFSGSRKPTGEYVPSQKDLQLIEAFRTGSSDALDRFFKEWQTEIPPIDSKELESLDRNQQAVYALFKDFYKWPPEYAKEVSEILKSQADYDRQEYLVVQNEIEYKVVADDEFPPERKRIVVQSAEGTGVLFENPPNPFNSNGWIEITNFRPSVESRLNHPVYLNEEYNRALNYLMNEEDGRITHVSHGSFDRLTPKVTFLENKILLQQQHDITGFHYVSFPLVYRVVLNESHTRAFLSYRDSWCTGGRIRCTKEDGRWKTVGYPNSWGQ